MLSMYGKEQRENSLKFILGYSMKKTNHTGLKRHQGEWQQFSFLGDLPFNLEYIYKETKSSLRIPPKSNKWSPIMKCKYSGFKTTL